MHFHVNVTSGSLWRWRRMEACPFLIPCSRGERMAAWLSPSTGSPHTLGHMRRMLCQWRCPRWCIRSPAVVARLTALLYGLTLLRWSRSPSTVPFFTIQQVSSTYLFQCQFFKNTYVQVRHNSRDGRTHRCTLSLLIEVFSVAEVG